MNLKSHFIMGIALSFLFLSACSPVPTSVPSQPSPTVTLPAESLRLLSVSDVSIETGAGSPGLLEIIASGDWPDPCAQLAQVTSRIDGLNIQVSLYATAADPSCPPDYSGIPFRIPIPLNPVQLPQGMYTVTVNSAATSFEWTKP